MNNETHQENCIFCQIISRQIESKGIFYETDKFIAFLSIFPNTEGFTVLATKDHYPSDVLNLPTDVLKEFIAFAQTVSKILLQHFQDAGRVGLIMEGTGINHAHIKLSPMHNTPGLKNQNFKPHPSHRKDHFKEYPGYLISTDGPQESDENIQKLAQELKLIGQKTE